jgi:hypothetical protein
MTATILAVAMFMLFAKPASVVEVNALTDTVVYEDSCGHMFATTYNGTSVGDDAVLLMNGNCTVSPNDDIILGIKVR